MIRKAVIPAAGFGTRFLPASKSQPKEMLPIVDTPVIQYVVEEAVASGITDILMVIGKGKRAIEEHFDRNFELERELAEKGKERRAGDDPAHLGPGRRPFRLAEGAEGPGRRRVLCAAPRRATSRSPCCWATRSCESARAGDAAAHASLRPLPGVGGGAGGGRAQQGQPLRRDGRRERSPTACTWSRISSRSRTSTRRRRTWPSPAATCSRRRSSTTLAQTPRGKNNEIQLTDAMRLLRASAGHVRAAVRRPPLRHRQQARLPAHERSLRPATRGHERRAGRVYQAGRRGAIESDPVSSVRVA